MNFDWRGNVILQKIAEGCLVREAEEAAGITKRAVHLRMKASPELREAVALAREQGRDEWKFRRWLSSGFRQIVGYVVPTWYGNNGWGSLKLWQQSRGGLNFLLIRKLTLKKGDAIALTVTGS